MTLLKALFEQLQGASAAPHCKVSNSNGATDLTLGPHHTLASEIDHAKSLKTTCSVKSTHNMDPVY